MPVRLFGLVNNSFPQRDGGVMFVFCVRIFLTFQKKEKKTVDTSASLCVSQAQCITVKTSSVLEPIVFLLLLCNATTANIPRFA